MDILHTQDTPEQAPTKIITPNKKVRKASKWAIFGAITANVLTVGAGAACIGIAAWKYQTSSDFSHSYNMRFELDNHDENPLSGVGVFNGEKLINSQNDFKEKLNETADEYSQYLHNKGISNFNVYPEFVPAPAGSIDPIGQSHAYINVNLPSKTFNHDGDSKMYDPSQIFMDNISSSRISIVLDMHDLNETSNTSVLSVIPIDKSWIDFDSTKINSANPKQVDIKLNQGLKNIVEKYYKQTPAPQNSRVGEDTAVPSSIYIVRDFNGLMNRMVYTDQIEYMLAHRDPIPKSNELVNTESLLDYGYGTGDYNSFYTKLTTTGTVDTTKIPNTNPDGGPLAGEYTKYYNYNIKNIMNDRGGTQDGLDGTTIAPYFFGNVDGKPVASGDKPAFSFMSNYVLAVGKASENSDTPDSKSYLNILPSTSPTDKNKKEEYNWLTIKADARYTANNILDGLKHFAFELPQKVTNVPLDDTSDKDNKMFTKGILFGNSNNYGDGPRDDQPIYGIYNEIQKVKANLSNNIFTTKPLIGILIAVIAIMLLIGIVVSVLYRIPGAFGFFSLFSAFSIALMVMILTGFVITLPIFIGLLIGLIAGTFAIFAVCERIKKQARTGVAFDVAVKKGLKRSILPIIDIHIILIVIGMCLSFIGFTELTAVGNAMLILGLISAVFMGPVFFGVTILFFLNGFNRLKTNLMLSKKFKMINSNNVINGKQYETTLNGGFEIRRFHIFGWKQIVALSVVLAIIIAGIILLFTVGVHSSYMFYGGTRIVVTGTTTKPTWLPGNYANIVYDHTANSIYVYYSRSITWGSFACPLTYGEGVFVQTISSGASATYIKTTAIALSVASAILAAYAFVRLNWISMIPVFVASFAGPALMLAIMGLCQVYFDLFIVLAMVIVYTFGMFVTFTFVSSIYNQWTKRQIFNRQDLKTIFNLEIKNDLPIYAWLFGITIAIVLIFALISSTSLLWMGFAVIIGILATAVSSFVMMPFLQYWFMVFRYKYLGSASLGENVTVRKNYDDVDEQLIITINKFPKQKPTL